MIGSRIRVGRSAGLGSALVLVGVLALAPAQAAAKKPAIHVDGKLTFTSTDPPPGHGSSFPVTISGTVTFKGLVWTSNENEVVPRKLRRKARKRCLNGLVVPVTAFANHHAAESSSAEGISVTDDAGNFSGTVQFSSLTPGGFQLDHYFAGIGGSGLSGNDDAIKDTRSVRGRTLKCRAPFPVQGQRHAL